MIAPALKAHIKRQLATAKRQAPDSQLLLSTFFGKDCTKVNFAVIGSDEGGIQYINGYSFPSFARSDRYIIEKIPPLLI